MILLCLPDPARAAPARDHLAKMLLRFTLGRGATLPPPLQP